MKKLLAFSFGLLLGTVACLCVRAFWIKAKELSKIEENFDAQRYQDELEEYKLFMETNNR